MRKITQVTVKYEDGGEETWVGAGTAGVSDSVNPGPPLTSVSFAWATLAIPPRMEINKAGAFTGRRLPGYAEPYEVGL